ncbi:hypothetical protein [Pyxidicoccus xibeiensis]|uniref:hypothetical protein n=1 Tax=Pyxidicoccus xibeiensis TaxID=2906759 RepID=UPI0020A7E4C7|nr:hypothetical protein [Pyxidicoccus xibeiensis]MCP3139402.1 hypothetical protein [Pyxidicoccus xibeiensis]
MHQGGFRRWPWMTGALASAALLLGTACEREHPLPRTGGEYEGVANEQQPLESFAPGAAEPPATGGAGRQDDEFMRPQQQRNPGQEGSGGSGTPGITAPAEQPRTDQGGTREYEEQGGTGSPSRQTGGEMQGPRSPPDVSGQPQGGEQAPRQ